MIVLDASALVDLVIDNSNAEQVAGYLNQPVSAPGHQLSEVLSAVTRLLRAGEVDVATAFQALQDAGEMKQEIAALDQSLVLRAFELRGSIRVTDGLYVALAQRLNCPLLTTDGRLARADPPCEVIFAGVTS